MKFNINRRYNGHTGRFLNSQRLKILYLSGEQRVFKHCFPFFSIAKKWTFPDFPSEAFCTVLSFQL